MSPNRLKTHKRGDGLISWRKVTLSPAAAICIHEALLTCEDLLVKSRYEALLVVKAMELNGICIGVHDHDHFMAITEVLNQRYIKLIEQGKKEVSYFPSQDAIEVSASEAGYIKNKLEEASLSDEGFIFSEDGKMYISLFDVLKGLPDHMVMPYYEHKPEQIAQELGVDYNAFISRIEQNSRYPTVVLARTNYEEVILESDLRRDFEKVAPILGIGLPPHLINDTRYGQAAEDMYPTLVTRNRELVNVLLGKSPDNIYVRNITAKVAYDIIASAIQRASSPKAKKTRKKIFGLF